MPARDQELQDDVFTAIDQWLYLLAIVEQSNTHTCSKGFNALDTLAPIRKGIVRSKIFGIKLRLYLRSNDVAGFSDDFGVGFH
jgi:hypothetical protein